MKKMFFAALAATIMFASCNKEDNEINGGQDGKATTMGLSFTLPTAGAETRASLPADASDINATTAENKLSTISVYAFKSNGDINGTTHFSDVDADFAAVSGVYTLKDAKRIKTTTATRTIYIVANAAMETVATEAEFKTKFASSNNGIATPATGLVMSSGAVPTILTPIEVNVTPTPTENDIAATLSRINAKIVVTTEISTPFTQTFASVADAGFEVSYTIIDWAPGLAAVNSYFVENRLNGKLVTIATGRTGHATAASSFQTASLFSTANSDWAGAGVKFHYVGENAPENNLIGEATNVMVRTKAAPNRQAKVNAAGDGVEWVATGADFSAGFMVLRNKMDGKIYFCKDLATINAVGNLLPGADWEYAEYVGGYVYFLVTLNQDKAPKAVVARNQFVNVNITGIANGALGWPGSGVDGLTPPDPEDPSIDFPEPFNPEEPVEEYNTYMLVNVTVKPWAYSGTNVELK